MKTIASLRKTELHRLPRVDWTFTFAAAAYDLIRVPKLIGSRDMSADPDKLWRIDNALHLKGVRLQFRNYTRWSDRWDHDHYAACWATFAESEAPHLQQKGYASCNDCPRGTWYDWICQSCFANLKDDMQWTAAET